MQAYLLKSHITTSSEPSLSLCDNYVNIVWSLSAIHRVISFANPPGAWREITVCGGCGSGLCVYLLAIIMSTMYERSQNNAGDIGAHPAWLDRHQINVPVESTIYGGVRALQLCPRESPLFIVNISAVDLPYIGPQRGVWATEHIICKWWGAGVRSCCTTGSLGAGRVE